MGCKVFLLLVISVAIFSQECRNIACVCERDVILCNGLMHRDNFKFIDKIHIHTILLSNGVVVNFNFIREFPNLKQLILRNNIFSNCTQVNQARKKFQSVDIINSDCLDLMVADITQTDHTYHLHTSTQLNISKCSTNIMDIMTTKRGGGFSSHPFLT